MNKRLLRPILILVLPITLFATSVAWTNPTMSAPLAKVSSPQANGGIVGVVTAEDTGLPISGAYVAACTIPLAFYCPSPSGTLTQTDASGAYSLSVAPGSYGLVFFGAGDYAGESYRDKILFDSGDLITVTSDVTQTINVSLTLGGYITGLVTATANTAGSIYLYSSSGQSLALLQFSAGTPFSIGPLFPGSYKLRFSCGFGCAFADEYYNDKGSFNNADIVNVTTNMTTTNVNAQLDPASTILGRVAFEDTGLPAANRSVSLNSGTGQSANAFTDAAGYYTATLRAGTYLVGASQTYCFIFDPNCNDPYVTTYYGQSPTPGGASSVTVSAGQTLGNVNIQLLRGAEISGAVTSATTSAPLANIPVRLYLADGTELSLPYRSSETDASGRYRMVGIPPGMYKLGFNVFLSNNAFLSEFYDNRASLQTADVISTIQGQIVSNVNAQLDSSATATPTSTPTSTPAPTATSTPAPSATSTPSPTPTATSTPPSSNTTVVPVNEGGSLTTTTGAQFTFPANTFTDTVTITFTPKQPSDAPASGFFKLLGVVYELQATFANGGPAQPAPGQTYTIRIPYDESALGGVDERTLKLYSWDGVQWVAEPTSTVDTVNNVLTATPNHFSVWVVGVAENKIFVPMAMKLSTIVFVSRRDGNAEIYAMSDDGSNLRNLSNNPSNDYMPTWSPDRSKIAFVSVRDGNEEIYVMKADGTGQTRLTNHPRNDSAPTWSPDGTKIAFASLRDVNSTFASEIYVMNADGTNVQRLTFNNALDSAPDWSPDGTKIAFYSTRDGNFEIYVMSPDGSNQMRLTTQGGLYPAWSPDGQLIAFNAVRTGGSEIYTMAANGANQTRLTNAPNSRSPAWSRDGSRIYFETNGDIFSMNPDGTQLVNLTNAPAFSNSDPE